MSAPTTPAEMADWLEQTFGDELWPSDEDAFGAVIAYLRRQPTDAQKIEALKLASIAGEDGCSVADDIEAYRYEPWRLQYARYEPSVGVARAAAANAREAMRLLGLPTGDDTP